MLVTLSQKQSAFLPNSRFDMMSVMHQEYGDRSSSGQYLRQYPEGIINDVLYYISSTLHILYLTSSGTARKGTFNHVTLTHPLL